MKDKAIKLLGDELKLLISADNVLKYTYKKCEPIEINMNCSQNEIDFLELLTSRFARLSDILIKKIFRLIEKIDLDDDGTIRDTINRAEKKGLIKSADLFVEIRTLRNDFAHEYIPEAMTEIFVDVFKLTPELFDSVNRVKDYCKKYE